MRLYRISVYQPNQSGNMQLVAVWNYLPIHGAARTFVIVLDVSLATSNQCVEIIWMTEEFTPLKQLHIGRMITVCIAWQETLPSGPAMHTMNQLTALHMM